MGEPTQIVRPLDRETGRARGFAFVEYADRPSAEAAIKQFDGQLFMGRPLAVSEARAREDRGPGGGPGGPRPGGFGGPRPGGPGGGYAPRPGGPPRTGGFGGPRPGGFGSRPGSGEGAPSGRERNFGPPAPPKGKKGSKSNFQQKERGPKGPIPTKFSGRMYDLDEVDAPEDVVDEIPEFMKPDQPADDEESREAERSGDSSETDRRNPPQSEDE